MTNIQNNLAEVRRQVEEHLSRRQAQNNQVPANNPTKNFAAMRVLAVSKTHSAEKVEMAYAAGQTDFGENYMQEAIAKIQALQHLPLCWHFIGHLQSNKARLAAENFDWVQSVDSLKLARKLSAHSSPDKPLNLTVQINISKEEGKFGIEPELTETFCQEILSLPNIKLRGLMAIPEATNDPHKQQGYFNAMHQLFQTIDSALSPPDWDTLSMGMSGDIAPAIAAGSNMLRLGTVIFGSRV